mgnify:CR=1 FL=1
MSKTRDSVPTISVVCIALNPALDQTIEVRDFKLGKVNRAQSAQIDAGGKGVNVASCLADYRSGVAISGLLGRDNAGLFEQLFEEKQITDHCLYVEGMTRVNTKLVDPERGLTTDNNLPGTALEPERIEAEIQNLFSIVDELAATASWFVLSGSLPPAWPVDTYARIILRVRSHGRKVLLDASGKALAEGILAEPHALKPNEHELAELLGRELSGPESIAEAVRDLLEKHPELECVAVSMGEQGALFFSRTESLYARPLPVELVSTVGAGDAMVAGLVAAKLESLPLSACARLATAFSAAKLTRLGAHLPEPEKVRELAASVEVFPLETMLAAGGMNQQG